MEKMMGLFSDKDKTMAGMRDEDRALIKKQMEQIDEIIAMGKSNIDLMANNVEVSKRHLELMLNVGYLTKREMIAMHCLQGLLASGKNEEYAVAAAYEYAGELIELSNE